MTLLTALKPPGTRLPLIGSQKISVKTGFSTDLENSVIKINAINPPRVPPGACFSAVSSTTPERSPAGSRAPGAGR